MSLPPEVRLNYIEIIDKILDSSDITKISAKTIRKGIQDAVEYDITPQKAAIKELTLERFDIFNARENGAQEPEPAPVPSVETDLPAPTTNGYHASNSHAPRPSESVTPPKRDTDSDTFSDAVDSAPPKKKRKASVEDDAVLAAKLQAEENKLSRPTRGAGTRRAAPVKKKKTPKKKTSSRVRAEDDSDMEGSEDVEKPVRNTGFHKPMNLSPALSELIGGETSLSRPQTTKKLWEYIKSRDLQDPADKRFVICDDKMRAVFKTDKVHMFTMTKIASQQMYSPEE